jgi:transposase
VGRTPLLKRQGRYRRETSTMVALTITGKIFKRHFDKAVNAEKLIIGLKHFRRWIEGPIILIWDRSSVHRAKDVTAFLAQHPDIHIEWLPPYAPELNPEEYCHGNVKRRLRNGVFHSRSEIRKHLDNGFARLRKRPDLLLGCFQHAGLELNELW